MSWQGWVGRAASPKPWVAAREFLNNAGLLLP